MSVPQQILVTGAGPAGSVTALLLARAGGDGSRPIKVTLAEASRFPRDKVCGECLSPLALAVLERAGLKDMLAALGPADHARTTLVSPDGTPATHDLPLPQWGLPRGVMDLALLDAARSAGVEVLQPCRVERVVRASSGGEVQGVVATLRHQDNRVETRAFDLVVVSDGKSALIGDRPAATGDLGVKAHYRRVRADPTSIHLFSLNGHYGGLAAVTAGNEPLWNLALSVPDRIVRKYRGDLTRLLDDLTRANPFVAAAFRDAERVGETLASPLPRFPVRDDWPPGVVCVGNAAAALEPIGGEGMGLALRSAELAAEAILAGRPLGELRRDYRRLWRLRRPMCRLAALSLSHPPLASVIIPLSTVSEPLTDAVLTTIGKRQRR